MHISSWRNPWSFFFFFASVCDIKMILAYSWELEFLMRVIRRQLSVFDWLPVVVSAANGYSDDPDFLHRAETPQLRELCEGEIGHAHTHTNKAQSVKHTTFHVSLLNSSLSKRWQRHQQCCRKEAANRKLVGCKENEASDNELKRCLSQYFIVSPWLAQSKHEWAVHTVIHARKNTQTRSHISSWGLPNQIGFNELFLIHYLTLTKQVD